MHVSGDWLPVRVACSVVHDSKKESVVHDSMMFLHGSSKSWSS